MNTNDLKLRLSITRWPHQVEPNTDWSAGSDVNYIKNLAQFGMIVIDRCLKII